MSNGALSGNSRISISGFRALLSNTLEEAISNGWTISLQPVDAGLAYNAILEIRPARGRSVAFHVTFKQHFEPRDISLLDVSHLTKPLLIVAPHLSLRTRTLLRAREISFIDTTGNAWIVTDSIFIDRTGAEKAPKNIVEKRPRRSLRGPITGRIVRFLCDTKPPMKVREIAIRTNANPGNVSRILKFLEREHLIERTLGGVSAVDWETLLSEWSGDLGKDRVTQTFLEPRGVEAFNLRLAQLDIRYAITGAFASAEISAAALPISMDVYVNDIEEARSALELRHSDRIGNVRLVQAFDRVAFERTIETENGLVLASPTQIAADLGTLPSRSRDEYAALLRWMKTHESIWRR